MIDCSTICGKIIADQLIDCNSTFIKGIEQSVLVFNRCDIETYTIDDTGVSVSAINLKSGATGYLIQGIPSKSLFSHGHTMNVNEDAPDDFTHTISLRGWNLTTSSLAYIKNLAKGADLVAITLDKTEPNNANKYKIHGLQGGLKVGEYSYNSNENRGAYIYTLISKAPDFEDTAPLIWLEGDIPATDAKYLNKLAIA